jgi:hypothetical protein
MSECPTVKLSGRSARWLVFAGASLFSAGVLVADLSSGPFIRMPVLFAFPIILVSWYCGLVAGESLAIGLPIARTVIESGLPQPWGLSDMIVNTIVLVLAFSLLSFLVAHVNLQRKRIRVLQGLLPICSFCKRIRTGTGHWEQMEAYISQHSEAKFSHGVCPVCAKREYDMDPG